MNPPQLLFAVGVLMVATASFAAVRATSIATMLIGTLVAVFGTSWGLAITGPWQTVSASSASELGHAYAILSSITGGALISCAFVELRQKRAAKQR